jgi:hypothetical protein
MDIFPIGTISADSSSGTVDDISYDMFEPNLSCRSTPVYNILVEKFEQQTMHTRKKSEAMMVFLYEYDNILDREYRQIEHFIHDKEGSLTSFYLVDFSKGITPSSISESSGDWVISIDDTRLFSSITNKKSYHGFVWDGLNWKEGTIASISDNTSITLDVDTNNYGGLSLANAQKNGILYPMYIVYAAEGIISNFKNTVFIDGSINKSSDGGWMRSGSANFVSKYKI